MYVQHNDITRMLKQNVQGVSKRSYSKRLIKWTSAKSEGGGVWTIADNVC